MNGMGAGSEVAVLAGAGTTARVLDFRRRPAPPRRRRRNIWWVLLRPLLTALGMVALPVGLAAWVLGSPRFALREVTVAGTARIPAAWIERAVAPLYGRNLVSLPLAAVTTRISRHPWIATLAVEKELPGGLRIAVTERRPVALLAVAGARGEILAYADMAGRPIAPVSAPVSSPAVPAPPDGGDDRDDLLVVRLAPGDPGGVARALAIAGELGKANATWAAALTRVDVLGEEDFRLETGALPFPLLVRRGQVGPKVRRLQELLPELRRRYEKLEGVDLRFTRRIVVQPAVSGPPAPPGPSGGAGAAAAL